MYFLFSFMHTTNILVVIKPVFLHHSIKKGGNKSNISPFNKSVGVFFTLGIGFSSL